MRKGLIIAATLAMGLAISGCGVRRDLKPRLGHNLPVAPFGQTDRPGSAELLTTTSTARPGRNVELHLHSEVRVDDPYDLPPKD